MSWDKKEDYCGLAVEDKLICKASNQNRGLQTLEKNGRLGQIAATRYFADVGAPSCDYTVASALEFKDLRLGAVTAVDGRNYALQSISVKTSAGAEPTFSATSQQVEDTAAKATANTFAVPEFSLSPDEVAQFLFNAFTLDDAKRLTASQILEITVRAEVADRRYDFDEERKAALRDYVRAREEVRARCQAT